MVMDPTEALYRAIGILGELALDKGQVSASAQAGTIRLVDTSKHWKADIFKGCVVRIVYGFGTGQKAIVMRNGANYLEVSPPWKFGLSASSMYVVMQDMTAACSSAILTLLSGRRADQQDQPPILDEIENIETKLDSWVKFLLGMIQIDAFYVEHHFHTEEDWFGISADQSGDNWGTIDRLTPYQVTTGGANAFGNEIKVLGSADTPIRAGKAMFDLHRIVVIDQSATTLFYLRFVWGTGTFADALAAGQYSTVPVIANSGLNNFAGGAPVDVRMSEHPVGAKVWAQAKNAAGSQTIDFVVGVHEYGAIPSQ